MTHEFTTHDTRPKLELPPVCCKTGCDLIAVFQPTLLFWAEGDWRRDPKTCLHMELGLTLCSEHVKGLDVNELLTDEAWQSICDTIKAIGRAKPDRNSVRIELKRLGDMN